MSAGVVCALKPRRHIAAKGDLHVAVVGFTVHETADALPQVAHAVPACLVVAAPADVRDDVSAGVFPGGEPVAQEEGFQAAFDFGDGTFFDGDIDGLGDVASEVEDDVADIEYQHTFDAAFDWRGCNLRFVRHRPLPRLVCAPILRGSRAVELAHGEVGAAGGCNAQGFSLLQNCLRFQYAVFDGVGGPHAAQVVEFCHETHDARAGFERFGRNGRVELPRAGDHIHDQVRAFPGGEDHLRLSFGQVGCPRLNGG